VRESPSPNSEKNTAAPLLSHGWWVPSAFAILALILLLLVPSLVDKRIAKVRGDLVVAGESARVLVNDLEASFASQLLVRNSKVAPQNVPTFATRTQRDADNAQLAAAVQRLGPEATKYYSDLNDRLDKWDLAPHDESAISIQEGLQLLASAERLDSLLAKMSDQRRREVRRLERIDVITPAILSPVALIAIFIVMWAGRRTLRFARIAEQEREEAIRAGEARAALLRGVTHDVKNPLGAAAGYAQLIEDGIVGPVPPRQLEMIQRINRLVQTASHTIADLLELARGDGELRVQYITSDLGEIVNQVVEDHRGMARERGIDLDATAPPNPIETDPTHVRQILSNVISNAIKYTPPGGRVHASIVDPKQASKRGEVVGVEIRDTGPGIPRELHEKVFEEFFRAGNVNENGNNGNGLGLASSRRLARLLGGDITLDNADGGGAAFTLWLTSSALPRSLHERGVTTARAS
jgi:signal transduction histidine kinase